jgi:hypothetical protein
MFVVQIAVSISRLKPRSKTKACTGRMCRFQTKSSKCMAARRSGRGVDPRNQNCGVMDADVPSETSLNIPPFLMSSFNDGRRI